MKYIPVYHMEKEKSFQYSEYLPHSDKVSL